jgi:hypothetical protein
MPFCGMVMPYLYRMSRVVMIMLNEDGARSY